MSLMTLAFAVCKVAVAPLRKEASNRSEMVSQVLFGEKIIIKEIGENNGWIRVMCEWDEYEGWLKEGQVQIIDKKLYKKEIQAISSNIHDCFTFQDNHSLLPLGASLFGIKGKNFDWLPEFSFKGKKCKLTQQIFNRENIILQARLYLGVAYLWGGRTQMGIDCSGLVQMVFRAFNQALPRDAAQQIEKGTTVDFLINAQAGDLAFFDNEDGKIIHVGILLNNHEILHATESSGCVVIDNIDNGGIISKLHKKRTHQLRMIKNLF